jgi:iron-regulated transporter 1
VIYHEYNMLDALDDGQEHLFNSANDDAVEQMQQATLSDTEHRRHCRRLYISHVLSTWNSRLFEFGAFLFLAKIYPNTLLPASIYALARAASAALLSPCLGSYIDSADRLKAVRLSISMHACNEGPIGYR